MRSRRQAQIRRHVEAARWKGRRQRVAPDQEDRSAAPMPAGAVDRARAGSEALSAADVLGLQRQQGNRAVLRMLAAHRGQQQAPVSRMGAAAGPVQRRYNTKQGRGEIWRVYNGMSPNDQNFDPTDLPQDFADKPWLGEAITQGNIEDFVERGRLRVYLPHDLAKEAYIGKDGRGERPVSVDVHDRVYTEHVAESNSKAETESLRRFNEDNNSDQIGHTRIFSWVIGGKPRELKQKAKAAVAKKARANLFHGNQQLGSTMELSTRQVTVEREEFKTSQDARRAGASDISRQQGTSRVSAVTMEKAGGKGSSTFTGSWDVDTNTWQLYHYAAAGVAGADFLQPESRLIDYRSPGHGTRATLQSTKMPHAGVADVAFG